MYDQPTNTETMDLRTLIARTATSEDDEVGFSVLTDNEWRAMSHAAVARRALSAAHHLRESGVGSSDVVPILYPAGTEFIEAFLACILVGAIAVPLQPLNRRSRTAQEGLVRSVLDECNVRTILANDTAPLLAHLADENRAQILRPATDNVTDDDCRLELDGPQNDVAYLQFTSGSTGRPRGVAVKQATLSRYCQQFLRRYQPEAVLSWLPHYHDLGLFTNVLRPIIGAYSSYIMAPDQFLAAPLSWLEHISRLNVDATAAPCFAFDLVARRAPEPLPQDLDLSCLRLALCGGEPIRAGIIDRFVSKFATSGFDATAFVPAYGLAEGLAAEGLAVACKPPRSKTRIDTLSRSSLQDREAARPRSDDDAIDVVSCGPAFADVEIRIVDLDCDSEVADGIVGRIWVTGTRDGGYWNDLDGSSRTFNNRLATRGEAPFLETGDVGFVLGGELFVTGRLKDMIVVGGQNYSAQDIEDTAADVHQAVRRGCVAAIAIERPDEELLCVIAEIDERKLVDTTMAELVRLLRKHIATVHGVAAREILFVKPSSIPKTSSGKLQRSRCRELVVSGVMKEACLP